MINGTDSTWLRSGATSKALCYPHKEIARTLMARGDGMLIDARRHHAIGARRQNAIAIGAQSHRANWRLMIAEV